jgi:rubrerythrin
MAKRDDRKIMREYRARQSRQLIAIAAAMFLVLLGAVFQKRADLLGPIPQNVLFGLQAISIAGFLGYTFVNWRCPACGKLLGSNIHRQRCGKCGARLQ